MGIFYGLQTSIFEGLLRPAAYALFTVENSETPVTIWADADLTIALSNPLTADAGGRWPAIYLAHTIIYRVRLYDDNGTLLREENPFSPEPPIQYQPLSDDGDLLPGAVLTFWRSQTDALIPIYADSGLEDELPNPITADETGTFLPIHLDDSKLYRVRLETADGVLRFDIDPYLSPDAAEYFTSRPYAIEDSSYIQISIPSFQQSPSYEFRDGSEIGMSLLSGEIRSPLVSYGDAKPEAIDIGILEFLSGEIRFPIRSYDEYAPEAIDIGALEIIDGELRQALITYGEYQPEAIDVGFSLLGGTLS